MTASPIRGKPLPLHAYFWRRRSIAELQALGRNLKVHRDDILRLQEKLTRRVTGIDEAMAHLAQAVASLDATTDAAAQGYAHSATRSYPPRPRGRPPKLRKVPDATPEAAE
jgi:hypothetical protein